MKSWPLLALPTSGPSPAHDHRSNNPVSFIHARSHPDDLAQPRLRKAFMGLLCKCNPTQGFARTAGDGEGGDRDRIAHGDALEHPLLHLRIEEEELALRRDVDAATAAVDGGAAVDVGVVGGHALHRLQLILRTVISSAVSGLARDANRSGGREGRSGVRTR